MNLLICLQRPIKVDDMNNVQVRPLTGVPIYGVIIGHWPLYRCYVYELEHVFCLYTMLIFKGIIFSCFNTEQS